MKRNENNKNRQRKKKKTSSSQSFVLMKSTVSFDFSSNTVLSFIQMYLQLVRKMRKIKALFIHSNERQANKGTQGTERKTQGERQCFGKSTDLLKPSRFSWTQYPVSLLRYLHTKPIKASSAATDLSSPKPVRRSGLELAWFGCLVHDQKSIF